MRKRYFELVVSVLDSYYNRVNVINITGSNNLYEMEQERRKLDLEIKNGTYDKYKKPNTTLSADIEIRDNDTNELICIF